MHRRKRMRIARLPKPMEIYGGELSGINKPLQATTHEHKATNIQTLKDQLENITVKEIVKEHKMKRKPKYIDTSSLLRFTR